MHYLDLDVFDNSFICKIDLFVSVIGLYKINVRRIPDIRLSSKINIGSALLFTNNMSTILLHESQ